MQEQRDTNEHKQTNTDTKTTIHIFLAEWKIIHKAPYPLAMTAVMLTARRNMYTI